LIEAKKQHSRLPGVVINNNIEAVPEAQDTLKKVACLALAGLEQNLDPDILTKLHNAPQPNYPASSVGDYLIGIAFVIEKTQRVVFVKNHPEIITGFQQVISLATACLAAYGVTARPQGPVTNARDNLPA
jgi:hypothetical protein